MKNLYLLSFLLLSATILLGQSSIATIGAGTNAGLTNDNAGPIYRSSASSAFDFSQHYYLFTAAELMAAGMTPGSTITSIAWEKTNAFGTVATNTASSLKIYAKNTFTSPSATWSSSNFATQSAGSTLVYSNSAQIIPTSTGYITLTFQTPFLWTGSSLEIGVSWDCSLFAGNPTTGGFSWRRDPTPNQCFGGSSSSNTISMVLQNNRPLTAIGYTPAPNCTAAPSLINITSSSTTIACAGGQITLNALATPSAPNYTYQWESSADNITFTPIANATNSLYTTNINNSTYFRIKAACGTNVTTSSATQITVSSLPIQIVGNNKWTENFDNLTTLGSNNFPSCWTKENGDWLTANASHNTNHDPLSAPNYLLQQFSATNEWIWSPMFDLKKDTTYQFGFMLVGDGYAGWQLDVGVNKASNSIGATILNNPLITPTTTTSTTYQYFNQRFTPTTNGTYSFGLRLNATPVPSYLGFDNFSCEIFRPVAPSCVAPILPTNNATSVCSNGVQFSWEADTKATAYDLYLGTTAASMSLVTTTASTSHAITTTLSNNTTYFWKIVPKNTYGLAIGCTTNTFTTANAPCPCDPNYTTGKTFGDLIANIAIGGTTLANNSGLAQTNPAYTFFSPSLGANYTASLSAGTTYTVSISIGSWGSQGVAAWIDYNDDGIFSLSERIGYTNGTIGTGTGGTPIPADHTTTFPISLSCNPPAGGHRMRIRSVYSTNGINIDPCLTYGYGETEDYVITILPAPACPQPSFLTGTRPLTNAWNSHQIDWTIGCSETEWDIFVQTAGLAAPSITTTPTVMGATTHPYILSGLNQTTNYEYWVRAVCNNVTNVRSVWSGPFSFTTAAPAPDCPTLNTPLNGASNVSLNMPLAWTAATTGLPTTSYDVYWGTSSNLTTAVSFSQSATSYITNPTYNTTYYWQIRPINGTGQNTACPIYSYKTDTLKAPDCPIKSTPANGTTLSYTTPTFSWSNVVGATNYSLYVSTITPVALTTVNLVTNTSATSYQLFSSNLLKANTTYYWTVVANNTKGASLNCGEFLLNIDSLRVPDCPVKSAPSNGAVLTITNPTITWASTVGALDYSIYVSTITPVSLTAANFVTSTNATSYKLSSPNHLNPNTTYYWTVVANNVKGVSTNCSEFSYKTGTNLDYCMPTFNSFACSNGDAIARIQLNTLDNQSGAGCPGGATGYSDYRPNPALTTTLNAGTNYNCVLWAAQYSENYSVWIDFNDNGVFETTERVGYSTTTAAGSGNVGMIGGSVTFQLTIPCNAISGKHTMRVRCAFSTPGISISPCGPGNGSTNGYGEVEDYYVTIAPPPPCPAPNNMDAITTASTATLSWIKGCNETTWDVHVGIAGIGLPTMGTVSNPALSNTTLSLSNLIPGTYYEFWVRAVCGVGNTSTWNGPFTFITKPANDNPCDAQNLILNAPAFCQNTTAATVSTEETNSNLSTIYTASALNNTVWFKFTPTVTKTYNLTINYGNFNSNLKRTWTTIYTANGMCTSNLSFTQIMASDANNSLLSRTISTPTLTAGITYFLLVEGFTSDYGNFCIQISDDIPKIEAKVFLNQVNTNTLLMDRYVSTLSGSFPLTDPYGVVGAFNGNFTHKNRQNSPTIAPAILAKTGADAIVDWVFVELRQGTSGATSVIRTEAALIQADGDIVGMDGIANLSFPNLPAGAYYIAIRHRNHLGFRTSNTYTINQNTLPLNFTNGTLSVWGNSPLIQLNATTYAMVAADANSDGSIDAFDTILWETQNGAFDNYSNHADYNMDGSVDAFDSILWELHNGKFEELN